MQSKRKERTCYLDVETSTAPNHYPWSKDSFLSCVGILDADQKEEHLLV